VARAVARRDGHRGGRGHGDEGFTIIEVMVTMMIVAMLFALVVPNLGALVPSARLRGSGSQIRRELDWVRSEARIQGKRMVIEFDLEHAMWRIVLPPEQRLTRDDDVSLLEERPEQWVALETDVVFVGAGDGKAGLTSRGVYKLVFDEYGFTGDQVLVLALHSDPQKTWSMTVHGLSGRVDVLESDQGEKPLPQVPNEGAF
jgi:prepilin-type N-terminal cleavage/methylation domain-containing protein